MPSTSILELKPKQESVSSILNVSKIIIPIVSNTTNGLQAIRVPYFDLFSPFVANGKSIVIVYEKFIFR